MFTKKVKNFCSVPFVCVLRLRQKQINGVVIFCMIFFSICSDFPKNDWKYFYMSSKNRSGVEVHLRISGQRRGVPLKNFRYYFKKIFFLKTFGEHQHGGSLKLRLTFFELYQQVRFLEFSFIVMLECTWKILRTL